MVLLFPGGRIASSRMWEVTVLVLLVVLQTHLPVVAAFQTYLDRLQSPGNNNNNGENDPPPVSGDYNPFSNHLLLPVDHQPVHNNNHHPNNNKNMSPPTRTLPYHTPPSLHMVKQGTSHLPYGDPNHLASASTTSSSTKNRRVAAARSPPPQQVDPNNWPITPSVNGASGRPTEPYVLDHWLQGSNKHNQDSFAAAAATSSSSVTRSTSALTSYLSGSSSSSRAPLEVLYEEEEEELVVDETIHSPFHEVPVAAVEEEEPNFLETTPPTTMVNGGDGDVVVETLLEAEEAPPQDHHHNLPSTPRSYLEALSLRMAQDTPQQQQQPQSHSKKVSSLTSLYGATTSIQPPTTGKISSLRKLVGSTSMAALTPVDDRETLAWGEEESILRNDEAPMSDTNLEGSLSSVPETTMTEEKELEQPDSFVSADADSNNSINGESILDSSISTIAEQSEPVNGVLHHHQDATEQELNGVVAFETPESFTTSVIPPTVDLPTTTDSSSTSVASEPLPPFNSLSTTLSKHVHPDGLPPVEYHDMDDMDVADKKATTPTSPAAEFLQRGSERVNEVVSDAVEQTAASLRKHARLAVTGGVGVNEEVAGEVPVPELDTAGMTRRILQRLSATGAATGDPEQESVWDDFQHAEEQWAYLDDYMPHVLEKEPPTFVMEEFHRKGNPYCFAKLENQATLDYDIAVCGGKLGVFFALALQLRGHNVILIEGGKLEAQEQEWNISMEELLELQRLGIVTQEDIDASVQTQYEGCWTGFKNKEIPVFEGYVENGIGYECFTEGVKNVGVSPSILVMRVLRRFIVLGGVLKDQFPLEGLCISEDNGVALDFGIYEEPITAKLVIDAMGGSSPIARQQRFGTKPDGICVVVGSCAGGFDPDTNVEGDLAYTNNPIEQKQDKLKMQYFWESFPVGIGRNGQEASDVKTTYMFTCLHASQRRPTLESLLDDYWKFLPQYQPSINNPEEDLDVKRVMYGFFPLYEHLEPVQQFHRVLAVGDTSGSQNPISFGGFGPMIRNLDRITSAVTEAIDFDLLSKEDLAEINAYMPNRSALWLLQKAMVVRRGQLFVDRRFVNRFLSNNLEALDDMGPETIKPFLQDVGRLDGLVGSLTKSLAADPTMAPQVLAWIGLPTFLDWFGHVSMMGTYAALDTLVTPWLRTIGDATIRRSEARYLMHRRMDAWRYGSGNDYGKKRNASTNRKSSSAARDPSIT